MSEVKRYTLGPGKRLHGRRAFGVVFAARVKQVAGPLVVHGLPNDLGHPRLGLSVSRRVGTAVKRNTIKRMLREAFRLAQYDLPRGYDLVIVVRPHDTLTLAEYQKLMSRATLGLHRVWLKRASTSDADSP